MVRGHQQIIARDRVSIFEAARRTMRCLTDALRQNRPGLTFLIVTREMPETPYDIKMWGFDGSDSLFLARELLFHGAENLDALASSDPCGVDTRKALALSSAALRAIRILEEAASTQTMETLS